MFGIRFAVLFGLLGLFTVGCANTGVDTAQSRNAETADDVVNIPESTGPRRVPGPHSGIFREPFNTIEGHWLAETAIMAGTAFPEEVTKGITLDIADGKYDVSVGGNTDQGTVEVDTSSEPNKLTILGTTGPNAGKTILAVYDFPEFGKMRVCYDITGTEFPRDLESNSGNGYFFVTYKRAPKGDQSH